MSALGLAELPDELFSLTHLRELHIGTSNSWDWVGYSGFDVSKSRITELTCLEILTMERCTVSDLNWIRPLTALRHLNCDTCHIVDFSPIGDLINLEYLYCPHNFMTNINSFASLRALKHLTCAHTPIEDLAPLGLLPALEYLDCSGCRHLSSLPNWLRRGPLRTLVLFRSYIPLVPREILSHSPLENCLDAVRAHLDDEAAEVSMLADVRLLLLGNGNVGKTQIARYLGGRTFQEDWHSTHGIQISGAPLPTNPSTKLQIWDFGGWPAAGSVDTRLS